MAESESKYPITIVHTEYGMCLTTTAYAEWRQVQDAFSGYKASLGPWDLPTILEYLPVEYPGRQPFNADSVRRLTLTVDSVLWAQELSDAERDDVPINVRAHAAAAGEILDRLDDLYDQRADALGGLLAAMGSHTAALKDSALGRLASASTSRLLDLDSSGIGDHALNRQALSATDELRLMCASTWAEDSAHSAVEHGRVGELRRLLDAGWDVNDPASDGETLLHHAIDIEVDGATQTGAPLEVELTTLLVSRGADLSHRWHSQTPLEAATDRGHDLAVEVIRAAKAGDLPADRPVILQKSRWAFWKR